MTPAQRTKLMSEWWPAACAAQGWDANDRDRRLAVLSEAVGRDLATASELDAHGDIDKVKAHLHALAHPDEFDPALMDADPAEMGQRRRLLHKIRRWPTEYVERIVQDVTGGECSHASELGTDDLVKLVRTLETRRRSRQQKEEA
jgi:hypothetical protein